MDRHFLLLSPQAWATYLVVEFFYPLISIQRSTAVEGGLLCLKGYAQGQRKVTPFRKRLRPTTLHLHH